MQRAEIGVERCRGQLGLDTERGVLVRRCLGGPERFCRRRLGPGAEQRVTRKALRRGLSVLGPERVLRGLPGPGDLVPSCTSWSARTWY